jgi:hypothetical protein
LYKVQRLWTAACLATAQKHYQSAATLFGMADQIHSCIPYAYADAVRAKVKTALATVQRSLAAELFVEAYSTGRHLSLDTSLAKILIPYNLIGTNT